MCRLSFQLLITSTLAIVLVACQPAASDSVSAQTASQRTISLDGQVYEISAWNWEASQPGSAQLGFGSGRATFSDLSIVLSSEELVVRFLDLAVKGEVTSQMSLVLGNITMDLEGVVVSVIGLGGSTEQEDVYNATLNFVRYTVSGGGISTSFDIAANTSI